jgi:hypothetical protein
MTKVFVLMNGSNPEFVSWNPSTVEVMSMAGPDYKVVECEVEGIIYPILNYFNARGLKLGNIDKSFQFLVSEVGEFADAIAEQEGGWTRNNVRERDPWLESGDVIMMLAITMWEISGQDPIAGMFEKFKQKGFPQEDI